MNQEIRERTKWFMDARFGMFIHWGLYAIPACGEWVMSEREMTVKEYENILTYLTRLTMIQKCGCVLQRKQG